MDELLVKLAVFRNNVRRSRQFHRSAVLLLTLVAVRTLACGTEGFISLEYAEVDNRWYFMSPDGTPFVSRGVNHVRPVGYVDRETGVDEYGESVRAKYGSRDQWAAVTVWRLRSLGFNTAGAWSSVNLLRDRIYFAVMLRLSPFDHESGAVADYFSPEYREEVDRRARATIVDRNLTCEPNLLGYFLDNELRWGPDWRSGNSIAFDYLNMDAAAPGKRAVIDVLSRYYDGDIEQLNRNWYTSFRTWREAADYREFTRRTGEAAEAEDEILFAIAESYFRMTTTTLRRLDPNHLILGSRFMAPITPRPVIEAAGRFVDVVSANHYDLIGGSDSWLPLIANGVSTTNELAAFSRISGRPVLVSEFGFRAVTLDTPSTFPFFFPRLRSQRQRGERTLARIESLMGSPHVIGYHLFQWSNQPTNGRQNSAENNNFGIVDFQDDLYREYTEFLERANSIPPARPAGN